MLFNIQTGTPHQSLDEFGLAFINLTTFRVQHSRDATSISKKVIFLIHRVASEKDQNTGAAVAHAAKQGLEKLSEVKTIFSKMQGDLSEQYFWRYQKNVSPSVQEYIEALSYAHYMASGRLVSHSEVQMSLCSAEGLPVSTSHFDSLIKTEATSVFSSGLSELSSGCFRPQW